jgi:hypothetical protein
MIFRNRRADEYDSIQLLFLLMINFINIHFKLIVYLTKLFLHKTNYLLKKY